MNSESDKFLAFQEKRIDAHAAIANIILDKKIKLLGEITDFKLRCVQSRSIYRLRILSKNHSIQNLHIGQR